MPDVFISYSNMDETLAKKFKFTLDSLGFKTFLASTSLSAGRKWKEDILQNLRDSKYVFFIATKHSCESQAVMHEIGGSLVLEKELIPLMWGISPEELPDWVKDRQAIDLQDPNNPKVKELIENVAQKVKADRFVGTLILCALGVLFLYSIFNE